MKKEGKKKNDMENFIKAYIQSYNTRIINNKLTLENN